MRGNIKKVTFSDEPRVRQQKAPHPGRARGASSARVPRIAHPPGAAIMMRRSEEVQREQERLQRAVGEEQIAPVLARPSQQLELARRAETQRGGDAPPGAFVAPQRLVLPRSALEDADALALSAQVTTVADANDLALLADALTRRSSDPLVQARAIFRWVAESVAFAAPAGALLPQDAAAVLERRTAAGDGHANLVLALGQHANLRVSCVYGHGRGSGEGGWRFAASHEEDAASEPPVNHCWNALYVGNSWHLLDAAYAAGSVSADGRFRQVFDEAYWLPSPAVLAASHKPVLSGWQLVAEPIEAEQYRRSVPRGAAFFRHGLELLSHPTDGTISCGQHVAIRIGHAPHVRVHFACVLVEECVGEEPVLSDGWPHECCMVETHGSWSCVHVTAPPQSEHGTGRWELRIMVAPGVGLGGYVEDTYRSMEWCASYRLDFGRCVATPAPSRFPYVARGVTLSEPRTRGIESGRVRFRIRWTGPAAPSAVAVVVPGIATATYIDSLQVLSTTLAGETQYYGVVDVSDAESDLVQIQAEFETATGTKKVGLAEFCIFVPEKPVVAGSELRTVGLRGQFTPARPAAVVPTTPPVESWGPVGETDARQRGRPPSDILELEALGEVYSDADFSAESGCLYHDLSLLRDTVDGHVADQWTRVVWSELEAVPGKTVAGVSGLETLYATDSGPPEPLYATESDNSWRNIIGGFLGDCAFLSCLTVLAEDMRLVRRMVVSTDRFASTRAFVTRFCQRGEAIELLSDGVMPVLQYAEATEPIPAFCHASDCLWPALLQKAYAKLRGSYQQALGDSPGFILQALTGGPSVVHPLTDDEDALEAIWDELSDAMQKGYVVCACAEEQGGVNLPPKQESHAYAILQVRDIAELDQQLVMLRNPLGHAWQDMDAQVAPTMLQDNPHKRKEDAERWPPELCQTLGVDSKLEPSKNGIFWVNLKDMHCFFSSIVVNKTSGGKGYHSATARLDTSTTVGGGTSFFSIQLEEENSLGDAVITVTQQGLPLDTSDIPPLSFSVWSVATGKQVGYVEPTAAEVVCLECSFDKVGGYYVIVDSVCNEDASRQVVLGVTAAGVPVLSSVPDCVPLGGGMHKIVARNGQRGAEGFYDPDSYFRHGLGGMSMTSWGMWSPAHLRYWRFIVHDNADDDARMTEVLQFDLENMEVFQAAEPWVSVALEPKQHSMVVLQSVGQASLRVAFQITSRKLQLENSEDTADEIALEETEISSAEPPATTPMVSDDTWRDAPVSDVQPPQESVLPVEVAPVIQPVPEPAPAPLTEIQRFEDQKRLEADAEQATQDEYERLRTEAALRLEKHQRQLHDRKQLQEARAEDLGLALELERRNTERSKLEEAAMGYTSQQMVIPSLPKQQQPPSKAASQAVESAAAATPKTSSKVRRSEPHREPRDWSLPTSEASRVKQGATPSDQMARAAKRKHIARQRAQHNEDRVQRKIHEANVMKAQARMRQDGEVDSWEQASELAKREAERMLKRDYERKQKQRKDRERRAHMRRQKQIEVLEMKASTNLNHWEEMHARVEADNSSRAKAAAARYTAEQKKKLQRDEFERKKKEMLEEQRKKSERAKREKWQEAEKRRKEDEARKEAEAKAERLAQEKSKRSSIRNAKRAAAMGTLQERLRKLFNVADADGDGSLSKAEVAEKLEKDADFLALLKEAGMKSQNVFQQLDIDGDGSISFLEFLKIMDAHSKAVEDADPKARKSVLNSMNHLAGAGDVAVLSNNTMELRMRVLLEEQTQKEAKEREARVADIARQVMQEDANQRMRQSMLDFDEKRKEEFAKIEENAKERQRVLVDKQRTYQKRLREMKKRQTARTEPFFLTSTDTVAPKPDGSPGSHRYICEKDTLIRQSMLSERSLRTELEGMSFQLLKKRAAAAGIATDQLTDAGMIGMLMERNKVGTLGIGEEVVGLEERIDEDNILQVRSARGWVARDSRDGSANLRCTQMAWVPTGATLVPKKPAHDAPGPRRPSSAQPRSSRQSGVSHEEHGSNTREEGFVESDPTSTPYQVEFETGDTGDVIGDLYLRLQGALGASKTVLCANVAWRHFERGSRCSFVFQAPWLGQIKSVAVGHNVGEDTHDVGTRMLLSNVVVRHMDTGTAWRFPCQQWLDDVSRMCVIPEAGSAIADGGHNAARSISYSGARVAFTPEEEQKLHRITVSLRAVAPETTSVPVTVDIEGTQHGQEYVKTVQLSLQIPDTTHTSTVETVGKFQCTAFGPLRSCTVRDITGACSGLGSKIHIYLEYVMVEVEGTAESFYFDCHRWLDSRDGTVTAAGPIPRILQVARVVHPSKRGLVEQMRDATATAAHVPATSKLSTENAATWHDVAEWTSADGQGPQKGVSWTDDGRPGAAGASAASAAAAAAAAEAGQLPFARESELLQHHRNYQEGQSLLQGGDMVYVVRILTGDAAAAKALRQTFRSVPPTVTLTLFGTHGPPMMIDVPVSFIPFHEERFIVRVQQYHGVLQGMRVSIDDTSPGAPALPFKWNLLSMTVTDMRRMQTWHSTCRSIFECSNSITAALLRPTATGHAAAHSITLVLGPGTAEAVQKSRLQVFISSVGGEGAVVLIGLPWEHDDPNLSTRAVIRCPEAWLPHLGDKLELGLCHCDDAGAAASVHVSQAIVVRDGVPMRFRFEREITTGAVHYGTPMAVTQEADLLRLDGGNAPAKPIAVDPIPQAEFVLRLHFTETCLYTAIECCIGVWQVEPNSSKFAVAWTPALVATKDAAYYASRESYEFPLTLPSPGAELWGVKIKAQGSSWGVGFVELVDQASREAYSCNCDGSPLVREELPDGTKCVSRELVFATKQPLEQVSRDPAISPWEEWKQDQARRADAAAEKEKRAAGQRGSLEMGLKFAQKAMRAGQVVNERARSAEELQRQQDADAREREAQRKMQQEQRDRQLQEAEFRERERQQEQQRLEVEANAAKLRAAESQRTADENMSSEEKMMKSNLNHVMEGTNNEYRENQCADALEMAGNSVPQAIMRLHMGKHGRPRQ